VNQYETPEPNIKEAADTVFGMLSQFDEQNFYNEYTPQIVTTNELQQIYELKNHITTDTKVLTVSGSGEQPLFFKLYGAKYIVTFDISYNAYLLTSLKIAAMQAFNKHTEYESFIRNLGDYCRPKMLMRTPKMGDVLQYLDTTQKNHLYLMDSFGLPVFLGDISCQNYTIPQNDYEKLRESIKQPFPFIWTDIAQLDKKLGDDKFDIIYYSNILGLMNHDKIKSVLEDTKKHIKPNGKLFLVVENKFLDLITHNLAKTYKMPNWCARLLPSTNKDCFNQIIIQNNQHTK